MSESGSDGLPQDRRSGVRGGGLRPRHPLAPPAPRLSAARGQSILHARRRIGLRPGHLAGVCHWASRIAPLLLRPGHGGGSSRTAPGRVMNRLSDVLDLKFWVSGRNPRLTGLRSPRQDADRKGYARGLRPFPCSARKRPQEAWPSRSSARRIPGGPCGSPWATAPLKTRPTRQLVEPRWATCRP